MQAPSQQVINDDWSDLAARLRPSIAGTAAACATPDAAPAKARATAPVVVNTVRGDRALAMAAAASAGFRKQALNDLTAMMVAPSAAASQDSLLHTWHSFHNEWFNSEVPALPLTSEKVYAVCAMFRAGGYRAIENYVSRIKDSHLEHGHSWTEFLDRACRKAKRAVT